MPELNVDDYVSRTTSDNEPWRHLVSWQDETGRTRAVSAKSADEVEKILRFFGDTPLTGVGVYQLLGRADQWMNSQKLH